jgi:hypothetical protein
LSVRDRALGLDLFAPDGGQREPHLRDVDAAESDGASPLTGLNNASVMGNGTPEPHAPTTPLR